MTDVLTPAQRRLNMSRIRGRDTKPEMIVRRLLHRDGYRYRLHRRDLPGKPDLVFPSRRCIVFVHGCFWHRHDCAAGQVTPRTNAAFWAEKIGGNVTRDAASIKALRADDWRVLVIWECETKNMETLARRLATFLA